METFGKLNFSACTSSVSGDPRANLIKQKFEETLGVKIFLSSGLKQTLQVIRYYTAYGLYDFKDDKTYMQRVSVNPSGVT